MARTTGEKSAVDHRRRFARAPVWLGLLLVAAFVAVKLTAWNSEPSCGGTRDCTRVLFLGDSYTFVNDLPDTFAALAASGGHGVDTGMIALSGETLARHAASASDTAEINDTPWNFVVLQEQSEIPSETSLSQTEMYPAVQRLTSTISDAGAQPLLFLTWGHRDGWPQAGLTSYSSMQAALDQGYETLSAEQGIPIAPVGWAWGTLLTQEPNADLWQSDGSHPTVEGTYLAACVFYATIFRQSPEGLSDHDGLSQDEAVRVQAVASNAVLGDTARWGLG